MRWLPLLVAVACTACFVSPVMRFGGKSEEQTQLDHRKEWMPAPLATEGTWAGPGEVRAVTVRVWADDDYRAQNLKWQEGFAEELEYVNAVLAPLLGIQLAPEYHAWERRPQSAPLVDAMPELERADPGDGAFTVIGLVSALPLVTGTIENLGYGNLPGKHIIVRGYADHAEREMFAKVLRDLEPDAADQLADARRRHKLAAVLLHELGHTLGCPHEDGETIMNPTYSHKWSEFSAAARARMLATVDLRLGRTRPDAQPVAAAPAQSPPPSAAHATLVIVVSAAGDVIVDGQPLATAALDALLRASFEQDHDTDVVIQAAHSAPRALLDQIRSRAQAIGLTHVR